MRGDRSAVIAYYVSITQAGTVIRGDRLAVIAYYVSIAQAGTIIRGDRFAVIPYFVSIAQVGIKRKMLVVDGVATRVAPNGGLELQIMI